MPSPRSRYLWSPLSDNFWIILCPLVALGLMLGIWRWVPLSDTEVYAVLFAFVVTGHHMPGWLRAFGEPTIYEQHKAKLWVSFLAVPAMIILPTYYGLGFAALVIAACFDLWHVAMQQHGFGRIYAAKDGDVSGRSARIDLACVLIWYAAVVFCSDSWTYGIAASFRSAGLPIFSGLDPEVWRAVKWGLVSTSLLLLVLYLHQAVTLWRNQRQIATRKHLLHGVAFSVMAVSYQDPNWYRAQSVQNLFHALQYFFIVWAFSHLSLKKTSGGAQCFYRALFKFRWGLALYVGAILLYGFGGWSLEGYSGRFPAGEQRQRMVQVLGSIGLASLLLHYYVDSFIWKVRTRHVHQALDLDGAGQETTRSTWPNHLGGAVHAVCYFGVPLALILIAGNSRRSPVSLETLARESTLYPNSAQARFYHGTMAMNQRRWKLARAELSAAHRLAPTKEGPALFLSELDAMEGRSDLELQHLRATVSASPNNPDYHHKLARALVVRGNLLEAESELRRALSLKPDSVPLLLDLAGLLHDSRRDPGRALALLRQAAEIDPDNARVAIGLAQTLRKLGNKTEALQVLRDYLKRNPDDADAWSLAEDLSRKR